MQVQSLKTTHDKQRAVIIGSGIAGIVAGQQLHDKGFEIVILEAKSQVGGRLRVDENFTDYPLELGAEWIHWQKTPYYDMCLRAGAKMASDLNNEDIVQDPRSRKMITIQEFKEKYPEEGSILEVAAEECDSIDPALTSQQWIEQKNFDPNLEYWYACWMGIEFSTSWTKTSAKGIGINQKHFPECVEQFTLKNMSHLDVLKHTCPDSFNSIQLNTPVLCVDYSKEYIMVQTERKAFVCDYVVCTVPISQLKKGAIKFYPEFDENRKTALSKMDMDVAIKIHLKFKERFWPDHTGVHIYDSKAPFMWDSSYIRSKTGDNVLCVFTAGDISRTAQTMGQQAFIDEICNNLSETYSVNAKELLVNYNWMDWGHEPYIEGGYSYPTVGEGDARRVLGAPINNRVQFAGEAYHPQFQETLHGATETAIEAARKISKHHLAKKMQGNIVTK